MQISIAALLTLLPALGMTCAIYDQCLCQNTDGSFNEAATRKACSALAGQMWTFDDGRHYCGSQVISAGLIGGVPLALNNCRFRKVCNANGAAGDSNCWGKE